MSNIFDPAVIPVVEVERVLTEFEKAELGQWYWVNDKDDGRILMCVMEIGSNYVQLHEPELRGYRLTRVHRDEFTETLTLEPNPDQHIQKMVQHYQDALTANLAEIQRLTESLGIAPQIANQSSGDENGRALAVLSGQVDVEAFKTALVLAKKETLPQLFERNGKLTGELTRWLSAPSMTMKAKLEPMKESVNKIEDRIFSISLYAGIFETVATLSDGAPAAREEKLRIMQRRLYMDEECLLDYESGGMEFKDIRAFDLWLAKPNNRDRILPFARCMVSMRVRRKTKDRDGIGLDEIVKFSLAQADKLTYLIIRNGEQLYRICTEIDFGELMFPERAVFDPSEPMMMKVRSRDRIEDMMTKREFDSRIEESNRRHAASEQWQIDNPRKEWEQANPDKCWHYFNPYRGETFSGHGWQPFDDSSVYFDQGMQKIEQEIKEYNRIALVVQGLFDRTHTLIPHNPVQMWKPASFAASVELVYDASMALHWGEAPDIHTYIAACNAMATADSIMFGQELLWMEREAERENVKTDNNWRIPSDRKYYYKTLRPSGDPGPGRVAKMAGFTPRSKVATFTWLKETRPYYSNNTKRAQIKAPLDKLFNVSAYQLGDYKRFFADPRTRAEYLEWAPMLMSAEDYHRGALAASEPLPEEK